MKILILLENETPRCMESECSLRCSQKPSAGPYPVLILTPCFFKLYCLILFSILLLGFQAVPFIHVFRPKFCLLIFLYPRRATYPAHLILLDLITLRISCEVSKLWTSSLCSVHPPATSAPCSEILSIYASSGRQTRLCTRTKQQESRDSSVGIALGYWLDDRGSRVRLPAGDGNFSLHHRVPNGSGVHPGSYPMGTRVSFPGSKEAGAWNWPLTYI
jgi:hypothetical protein